MLKPLVFFIHIIAMALTISLTVTLKKAGRISDARKALWTTVILLCLAVITLMRYEVCLVGF
jgi:hypothetical protein